MTTCEQQALVCNVARLQGCRAAGLQGYRAARLQGCGAADLQGCRDAGVQGCSDGIYASWATGLGMQVFRGRVRQGLTKDVGMQRCRDRGLHQDTIAD